MKRLIAIVALVVMAVPPMALAQTAPASAGQKTLASTMNIYVFPSKGQAPSQQSEDESACYTFAVGQTGVDPFQLQKQSEAQQQQAAAAKQQAASAGQGAVAGGAVKGAAAGALIGGISGDAGQGAAYGAAAGVIAGNRRKKQAQAQASAQVDQQAAANQQATKEQGDNFKKAFSVCLEAKNYMVKY